MAQGSGTISAYKEPTGMGRRVDGHGYVGYAPPAQYDPLLAKLICHHPGTDYSATVQRTQRAIQQFHIAGIATNLNQLNSILAAAAVQQGDARTSLLQEIDQDHSVKPPSNQALALFTASQRRQRRWPPFTDYGTRTC